MNEFAIWLPVVLTPTLTFAVVALGLFQNNKRIDDMRDLLRAEFKAEISPLRSDVGRMDSEMRANHAEMKQMLGVVLSKLDELEDRVSRLEERRS